MGSSSYAERRGREAPPSQLLERDWELSAIERVLTGAIAGVGAFMFIEGDPGSGKSQLLAAGERMAAQAGMRVLRARASELEQEFAFGVAIQLFEPAWLGCHKDERTKLVSGPARRAGFLFDGSSGQIAESSPDYPTIHGLFWMLCNLLSFTPREPEMSSLALIVDNVHWSDAPSMRFLAYLAERVEHRPVAVVLAGRPGEPGADPKLLARLRRKARPNSLQTRPLSEAAVATVVRRQFPEADQPFCRACAHVTGGNPFLLVELLDKLRQEEHLPIGGDLELARLVPSKVLDAVAAMLDAMPAAVRALAGAAAVLGEITPLAQAAAVAEIEPEAAARAADALTAERLLHPGVPLSFVHPLVREAMAVALSPLERAHLHHRAARVLASEGASAERVAAHLLEAPPAHDEATITVLREAARTAMASGRAERAAALLERALEERTPTELRVELALVRSDVWCEDGRYEAAAQLLADELAQPDGDDDRLRGELEAGYVAAASLVPAAHREAQPIRERMITAVSAPPSPRQRRAIAHGLVYQSLLGTPRHEVRRLADLAWADGALLEGEAAIGLRWPLLFVALMLVDEVERAVEMCDAVLASHRGRLPHTIEGEARCCRAWALYEQGRIAAAEVEAASALDIFGEAQATWTTLAMAVRAGCKIERGRLDEAEAALAHVERSPLRDPIHIALWLELQSRLRLSQHRAQEALGDALGARDAWFRRFGSTSSGAVAWRSTAALAHLALGQPEAGGRLAELELKEAERLGLTRLAIRNLRVLGLAVGGPRGIELLERAVETGSSYPTRLEHIRALVELGAALRRANRRAAAREPLRRGLALAEDHGAGVLARRARTELLATNANRRREALAGVSQLTASQRRVAELAARGLTTRQIAEALFVRPKTVEFHLRHVYQRLAIDGREQLAARLGIEPSGDKAPHSG